MIHRMNYSLNVIFCRFNILGTRWLSYLPWQSWSCKGLNCFNLSDFNPIENIIVARCFFSKVIFLTNFQGPSCLQQSSLHIPCLMQSIYRDLNSFQSIGGRSYKQCVNTRLYRKYHSLDCDLRKINSYSYASLLREKQENRAYLLVFIILPPCFYLGTQKWCFLKDVIGNSWASYKTRKQMVQALFLL